MNIRRDDTVIVLSGKDKGKKGKVLVADPKGGKISNESPMGKALMDHKKGDEVSFLSPSGKTLRYTVLAVDGR